MWSMPSSRSPVDDDGTGAEQADRAAFRVDDATSVLIDFASGCTGYLGTVAATAHLYQLRVIGTEGWAQIHALDRLEADFVDGSRDDRRWDGYDYPGYTTIRECLEAFAAAVEGGAVPHPARRDRPCDRRARGHCPVGRNRRGSTGLSHCCPVRFCDGLRAHERDRLRSSVVTPDLFRGPGLPRTAFPGEAGRQRCLPAWTPEQVRGDSSGSRPPGNPRRRVSDTDRSIVARPFPVMVGLRRP